MESKEKENEKKNKKEKNLALILIIIILILIILFLLFRHLGRIDNNETIIPTGYVDIFDLVFGNYDNHCNCTCHCHQTTEDAVGGENEEPICPICGAVVNEEASEILVYDKEQNYAVETPVNIFSHASYYIKDDLIAPGAENSYQFVVRNNNSFNLRYDLTMLEENKYNVNMRYRLKLNGKYVVGNDNEYVTVDKLQQYNMALAGKKYDVYTLDWKWVESDNDTEVGTNINSYYKLNLNIAAEQY